ncbi:protein of unknown function [Paenibacillus alvei]|uniref:Uncharacterized protein n=1 Tax=Paenibacillus alvei TaxID=44250 RepID=A0A383RKL7_PAEAL|nr:protein of unknown function [Paenibacillus alvei]
MDDYKLYLRALKFAFQQQAATEKREGFYSDENDFTNAKTPDRLVQGLAL